LASLHRRDDTSRSDTIESGDVHEVKAQALDPVVDYRIDQSLELAARRRA
jgi:hypothetical protein